MLRHITPHTIHEADIAVFRAWPDGSPMAGPNSDHRNTLPIGTCKSSLSITTNIAESTTEKFGDWSHAATPTEDTYTIAITQPFSSWLDNTTPVTPRIHPTTNLIIVIRFFDPTSEQWKLYQFFYARLTQHSITSDDQVLNTPTTFTATWLEDTAGPETTKPPLEPYIRGVVQWEHDGKIIPCFHFDPETETWTMAPENNFLDDLGNPHQYAYIGPDEANPNNAIIKFIQAFTEPFDTTADPTAIHRQNIIWQDTLALTIYPHTHPLHGLNPESGHTLQLSGCPTIIADTPSAQHLTHPTLRLRYLRRTYATITQRTICIPKIQQNTPPEPFIDNHFRIAGSGPVNPANNYKGLTLLPHTAYLDGILR